MKDEVFLRKLIADGEGVGEERRFQHLISFLRDLRNSTELKQGEAIKVLKQLDVLEISINKQKRIAVMNKMEAENFEKVAAEVDEEVKETLRKMDEAKLKLADARLVRRNRQEYSKIVGSMEDMPSRAETTKRLQEIRDELEQKHERQRHLESKLAERRNNLHAFNIILANFQRFLSEDDDMGIDSNENDDIEKDASEESDKPKVEKMEL